MESEAMELTLDDKKLQEEKRKIQDEVSNIMGEYLLKGYRMLDSYCGVCESILMQSRGSEAPVCIKCTLNKGPGTSQESHVAELIVSSPPAAQPQATPTSMTTPSPVKPPKEPSSSNLSQQHGRAARIDTDEGAESQATYDEDLEGFLDSSGHVDMKSAIFGARRALARKLAWASVEMDKTTSIEYCTQLATFIQSTSAAILRLKDL